MSVYMEQAELYYCMTALAEAINAQCYFYYTTWLAVRFCNAFGFFCLVKHHLCDKHYTNLCRVLSF